LKFIEKYDHLIGKKKGKMEDSTREMRRSAQRSGNNPRAGSKKNKRKFIPKGESLNARKTCPKCGLSYVMCQCTMQCYGYKESKYPCFNYTMKAEAQYNLGNWLKEQSVVDSLCVCCNRPFWACINLPRAESSMGPISSNGGVQFNNREITSIGERPNYTGEHDMGDATIKEFGWDLSRIVERETLVTTLTYGTSSTGVLYTGAVPGSLLSVAFAQTPFLNFLYWRGDVVLNLQIAGSPLVQGILAMTFVPLVSYSELSTMDWDFSSLSLNPTVYLYANTNTSAQLRIPFNHIQGYIGTNYPTDPTTVQDITNNLGFIVIYVLENFQTAGALTGVTVSLFSHLENSEFKVPQLSSTIASNYASKFRDIYLPKSEGDFLSSAISSLGGIGSSLVQPFMSELGSVAKTTLTSTMRMLPKQLANKMASKALPANFIGDSIDLVGGLLGDALPLLGLDNPTLPTEEGRMIVKGSGNMNTAVGPEFIEKLSILPSGISLVTPETFATVTDEMDLDYLYRKYSYTGRFVVQNTDAVGHVVWSVPLSPFPTFGSTTAPIIPVGTIAQTNVWFPLISYLGLPYRYWTGGLRYKFIVSASCMHTCKLFVAFNFGVYGGTAPTNLLDAASQYGEAIEINQGSNEFEFSVPYVALTPYLNVCTGTTTPDNSMGTMNVVVLNELVAPASVSPSISIAVFICGSDDFSYELIAGINPAFPVYDVTATFGEKAEPINLARAPLYFDDRTHLPDRIPRAESGQFQTQSTAPTVTDVTVTDVATHDIGEEDLQIAPPQTELVVDDHFGITTISLRNLAKKYQLIGSYPISAPPTLSVNFTVGYFVLPISDVLQVPNYAVTSISTIALPTDTPNGLLTWMQGMFKQFKGGLRFKIEFNLGEQSQSTVSSPFCGAAAYWYPGNQLTIANPITDIASVIPWTSTFSSYSSSGAFSFPNINTPRLACLAASTSNVLEFEVPYNSRYLSVLNFINDDELPTKYSDLGSLIVTCNLRSSSTITAIVYAAFADEARFGTLYRVPSVYIPAVYSVPSSAWTPVGNVGYGSYFVPSEVRSGFDDVDLQDDEENIVDLDEEVNLEIYAEGDRFWASTLDMNDPDIASCMQYLNSSLAATNISKSDEAEEIISEKLPEVSQPSTQTVSKITGTGRRRFRLPPISYMSKKVRTAVLKNPNMSPTDMAKLLDGIKPANWKALNTTNMGPILRRAGVVQGKDERYVIKPRYGNKNNNNRKSIRKAPLRRSNNGVRSQQTNQFQTGRPDWANN